MVEAVSTSILLLVLLSSSVAFPIQSYIRPASAYCTNSDLTYKLSPISPPEQGNGVPSYSEQVWNLQIDDTTAGQKQSIDGFGASVTDATVITFDQLSSGTLDTLLTELMTSTGANFGLMRHTIGASDMSPEAYTYDDNGGRPDISLENFTLGSHGSAMAKLLSTMKEKNCDLKVLGSSWSAPGWMKTNGLIMGNTTDNNLSDQYLVANQTNYAEQFAQYFVKYIEAYGALGVDVNAITIQNEPLVSREGYPTMYVYDSESGNLIQNYIGPALKNAGLETSIWAYDLNTDVPSYPQTVLDIASEYVSAVSWHCYAGSLDWSSLTAFHEKNPGVQQYMTECWTPTPDISATSTNWFQAANFTIGPLQNWASGVIAWTLATDQEAGPHIAGGGCTTCFGLVTISEDGTYSYNMAYYLMAQFSKFIPQGSKILNGTGSSTNPSAPGLQSVASLNPDGTRTVVILNTMPQDFLVRVNISETELWSGSVPKNSIVTWVLPSG